MAPRLAMKDFPRDFADAAWRIGTERGYAALTVRALAKALGVSVGLLYVHFEDKASLMLAVRRLAAERLAAQLDGELELSALCASYVAFIREHLWIYESEEVTFERRLELPHRDEFVGRARRSADITRTLDADRLATHVWMAMHSLAMLTRHETRARAEELIRDHIALWLRAFGVSDSGAPPKKTIAGSGRGSAAS